ncbi:cytochrome P450 [Corynespora cassiicola Philippines]|uniref:Cytochrome P450 n=1 Tax=Corynespora cassiicola Philippines TaxID=1448308 RepID=A0A2T2NZ39_CORCC|nr:cytochrome P450 [Corynespora cassiicola Philippines]
MAFGFAFEATNWSGLCRLVLVAAFVALVADYSWMLYRRWRMPPGPFPWPIIGNTFSLPDTKPWYHFEQLSKDYDSPVITFWIGRNPTIWVNDAWAANDIFVKRAGIYCSRPRMLVFAELGAGQKNLLNMYTETPAQRNRFRDLRKLTHLGVGAQQVQRYRDLQNDENKVAAYEMLSTPDDYVAHFERYATSVVSIIGYGRRMPTTTDPMITEVINLMHRAAALNVPGKTFPMLMETFPFLAKFPNKIAPWKHGLGNEAKSKHSNHGFFYALAEEANAPERPENYSKFLFSKQAEYKLHPLELSGLAANLLGAGSDTSSSTLITAVLAMRAFPETLPAAWEEIDRVVGPDRSPDLGDDLPYVRAFVKEVFRWRSVAIIGGQPHAPVQDDIWNGYLIPKGSWVQGNVWAIHHNEREFPEPDRFDPTRYLDNTRPFPGEKGYMTFGWGRRSCSGQFLAEQGTFLGVARLIWGFQIEPAVDKVTGKEIPVDIFDFTDGLNWRPRPFKVAIRPRNELIRQTIVREGEQALQNLKQFEVDTKYQFSTFYQE